MALDIFVADSHGNAEKTVPLYYEEYDVIMSFINFSFPILKRMFENYYGDSEIYLSELDALKVEIVILKNKVNPASTGVLNFIDEFLGLTDYAIKNRQTIKVAGD